MTADDFYLNLILNKYRARDISDKGFTILLLKNALKTWAGGCFLEILESGSRAKGTAISLASDVDYLVSLTSNCEENSGGLKTIYESLYDYLKKNILVPENRMYP